MSKIEWTEKTWNPVTGCTKVSQGCKNCYAEVMAKRLQAMGVEKYENGFKPTLHLSELYVPRWRKKPTTYFVCSMSDLFQERTPLHFLSEIFGVMNECTQHTFQVLTKRAGRLADLAPHLTWSPNIWVGVTVEDSTVIERIDYLKSTPAAVKFLSLEPLLSPLPNLPLKGIDWVIVGGESGRNARPMQKEWVIDIQQQCAAQGVPFFFKQWGGRNKKAAGRELNGKIYSEMPKCCVSKK